VWSNGLPSVLALQGKFCTAASTKSRNNWSVCTQKGANRIGQRLNLAVLMGNRRLAGHQTPIHHVLN
jgi:hypothetical protein